MPEENNGGEGRINRRDWLKGLTVAGVGAGAISVASLNSSAQSSEVDAVFCDAAETPPVNPPGGQAGQCINCVPCDNPVALEPLFSNLSGTSFTIAAEDIPEGADYLTLKTGAQGGGNCFTAAVPENPTGEITFVLTRNGQGEPENLQDISNATFYSCEGENPPKVDKVTVKCKSITIETSNIAEDEVLSVTVSFEDGGEETYEATVNAEGVAEVTLPGNVTPTHVTITYDGKILFDDDVTAIDGPCEVKCPDIDVKYVFKDGKWVVKDGAPDGLSVKGDQTRVTICADYPFVVTYQIEEEETQTVEAEYDEKTGRYCATIGNNCDEICWFRVHCPDLVS